MSVLTREADELVELLRHLPGLRKFNPLQPRDKHGKWSKIADFSGWTKAGERLGSNPGGVFTDGNGQKWYVKQQRSERHARNEALASALYKEFGANVPEVVTGEGAPGLDGPQTATRWEELDTSMRVDELEGFDREDAQWDFAADAWLANWDVVGLGFDNLVKTKFGEPLRLDQGGALEFRAMGSPKGEAFGDVASEWDTLRNPLTAPQAARIFGDMDDKLLAYSAERLNKVTHQRIRELVEEHGFEPELADKLIKRRADILRRAELIHLKEEAAAGGGVGSRGEKTGRIGLESVPVRLPDRAGGGTVPDLDAKLAVRGGNKWGPDKLEKLSRTARLYRAGLFIDMGAYLRGESTDSQIKVRDGVQITDENVKDHIAALDEVMDAAKLTEPVEVWRGIWKPEKVFGSAWSGDSMVGVEWTEKSFPSTSFEKGTSAHFSAGGVLMRLHVPAGTGGVVLSGHHFEGAPRNEAELLLDRNVRMRVSGETTDEHGRRVLDVDVLPGGPEGRAMPGDSATRAAKQGRMTPDQRRLIMDYRVDATRPERSSVTVRPQVRAIVRDLLRKFNPDQPRDKDGKWSKTPGQAILDALKEVAGQAEMSGPTSSLSFPDREGVPSRRTIEFEPTGDGHEWAMYVTSDELDPEDDEDPPIVTFHDQINLNAFAKELALVQVAADLPPFDPTDRRSVLLHQALGRGGGGAGFTNEDDESYIDVSSKGDGTFDLEAAGPDGNIISFNLNAAELAALHASITARSMWDLE